MWGSVRAPASATPASFQKPIKQVENLLADPDDRLTLIAHRDDGTRRTLTRRELLDLVSRMM